MTKVLSLLVFSLVGCRLLHPSFLLSKEEAGITETTRAPSGAGSLRFSNDFPELGNGKGELIALTPGGDVLIAGVSSQNAQGCFLAKIARQGYLLWSKHFSGFCFFQKIAVAPSGEIFLTGSFRETVRLGALELTSKEKHDVLVAKLSKEGEPLWAKSFGGPEEDRGLALAVAPDGSLVMAAEAYAVDFVKGPLSPEGSGIVLCKLSSDGDLLWHWGLGGAKLSSIVVDQKGDIVIAGSFSRQISLGYNQKEQPASLKTQSDDSFLFLAKYTPDGLQQWVTQGESTGYPGDSFAQPSIALDSGGEIFLASSVGSRPMNDDQYKRVIVVEKYSALGERLWSTGFSTPVGEQAYLALSLDLEGNLMVAGNLKTGHSYADYAGHLFLSEFTPDGRHRWSTSYVRKKRMYPGELVVDQNGAVFATGALILGWDVYESKLSYPLVQRFGR